MEETESQEGHQPWKGRRCGRRTWVWRTIIYGGHYGDWHTGVEITDIEMPELRDGDVGTSDILKKIALYSNQNYNRKFNK